MATWLQPSAACERRLSSKPALFVAFAFAVMADPVSSVAYAIEAALRALNGHLELLIPTMGIVIGIIALVTLNYSQLIAISRRAVALPRLRGERSVRAGPFSQSAP